PATAGCCAIWASIRSSTSACGSAKPPARASPSTCCARHSPATAAWRPSRRPASPRGDGPSKTKTPRPEVHRLDGLLALAEVAPRKAGGKPLDAGIAALGPEAVERLVAPRPRRVVLRPHDGAEHAPGEAGLARGLLPLLEEAHADAPAAIGLLQHRFAEIEE